MADRHPGEDLLVIGADTIVAVQSGPHERDPDPERARDWSLLGKPDSPAEARAMLERLAGSKHQVITGVSVIDVRGGAVATEHALTWVSMRPLSRPEILAYVATGEWRDKAGGYAIQESADAFVTQLEGAGFDNVVGLPVALTLELLDRVDRLRGSEKLAPQESDS